MFVNQEWTIAETCHMSDECLQFTEHIFSKKGIGENLLGLAVHGAVAMTFLVLFDNGVFHTLWHQLMCRGLRADVRRCQLDVADDIEENLDYKLVGPPPHEQAGVTGGTIRILEEQPIGPSCRDDLDVTDDCTVTGDSDEILERQLFPSSSMTTEEQGWNAVVLFRLSKRYSFTCTPYRRRYAVKDLTFYVKGGESFGLLGVNGAGKRTTFEILAGKRGISSGSASMTGHDVTTYGMETMKHIGYCGQPNAALDYMTCRETIWLYARLRGFAPENIEGEVDRLLGYFMMEKDSTKRAAQLSEGSTQKLNMAMTLTGNPTVLVLEEPTASVDPVARRNAWVCLNDCRKRGQTVVLSTHCMTEAETLCTRVGILQRGRLKFIGSTLSLKSRLARSHFLNIQVDKMLPTKEEELIRFVESTLPKCILSDRNDTHMSFKMMQANWSKLFSFIKDLKSSYPIVGYSVGDANLDELLTRTTR